MITRAAWLTLLLMAPTATHAQQRVAPDPTPTIDLLSIKTLTCTFSVSAVGRWKGGEPTGEVRTGSTVSVRLVDIETADNSAQMVGSGAAEEIIVQASAFNLHFMEVSRAGALTMTTVFGQESKPGRLKAVHTRTDYLKISMPGYEAEPTAAQYYGDCEFSRD